MNFYGHAVLAAEHHDHPQFVLGAMLPDLAGMAGLRVPQLQQAELKTGVAHHHLIDGCFHAAPQFVALVSSTLAQLCDQGVGRGPARAVAHVGVELLLDGWLLHNRGLLTTYRSALRTVSKNPELLAAGETHVLMRLSERLLQAPIPEGYQDPQFVTERLAHMLEGRVRLRLSTDDLPTVSAALKDVQNALETHAEGLMAHVRKASDPLLAS